MKNRRLIRHQAIRRLTLEKIVSWIVAFFVLLFSFWTLGHHAATFFHITWASLNNGLLYSGVFIIFISSWGAYRFSSSYSAEVRNSLPPSGTTNIPIILFVAISTALIFASSEYTFKFCITAGNLIVVWWLARKQCVAATPTSIEPEDGNQKNKFIELATLLSLVFIAVTVTLSIHRPDLDDSSFLQIASQTLLHQDRAPLTFDTSLGPVVEIFRFAPYRVAAYETGVAFVTEWTGISLLTVYYLLIPGITAGITVCVGYLFARWFLPSRWAILSTAIFLLVTFAWGETHVAYGNRVFVRLFQGKGLLIAVTTPITIIAGLMLLRRPSLVNVISLTIAHIAAIGVSSSGLLLTFFISMLLMIAGIKRSLKTVIFSYAWIIITLIYPAILVFWLKFQNESVVPLSEVGTYLPINASLGLGLRTAIALIALVVGFSTLAIGRQNKEYGLIVFGTLLLILNPWVSDFVSTISSKNMSWRLAWAAPVPLIISIGFVAAISVWPHNNLNVERTASIGLSLIGFSLFVLFVATGRWTVALENNVKWGIPTAKLPPEYYSTKAIAYELGVLDLKGTILSSRDTAAWLPLVAPGIELVMPGHTYPIMLQTVLPPSEFKDRMQLFNAVNNEKPNLSGLTDLIRQYQVTTIITPQAFSAKDIFTPNGLAFDLSVKKICSIAGHKIFKIDYGAHD